MSRRVAVLKGGSSYERQVSLGSGAQVEEALRRLGHEVVGIDVGPDLVDQLVLHAPDVAFIALHGRDGEDGTVQELLGLLGLPYTGSGPGACARGTDKALAKHLLREAGIPTPDFVAFSEPSIAAVGVARALPTIESHLSFPLVIKPAHGGSGLGVGFAAGPDEVRSALVTAFSYDPKVVVERHVTGRDLSVTVLEDDDGPTALPVVEVMWTREAPYESRYSIGVSSMLCPAPLDDAMTVRAQSLAVQAFQVLGLRAYARIDLMLDEGTGELTVLEANVVPGMTETSLMPRAAEAAGIDFDGLVSRVLDRVGLAGVAPTAP